MAGSHALLAHLVLVLPVLLILAADPSPAASSAQPPSSDARATGPQSIDAYPLRASQRPLTLTPHLLELGLGLGATIPGPYGPSTRTVEPAGDLIIAWSYAENREWRFPLLWAFRVEESEDSEHAFVVGLNGFGIGGDTRHGVEVGVISAVGAVTWLHRLSGSVALRMDITVGADGAIAFDTRTSSANLRPSAGMAMIFDLGEHFDIAPAASWNVTIGPFGVPTNGKFDSNLGLSAPITWHPNRRLDLGLRSALNFNARSAIVTELLVGVVRL